MDKEMQELLAKQWEEKKHFKSRMVTSKDTGRVEADKKFLTPIVVKVEKKERT